MSALDAETRRIWTTMALLERIALERYTAVAPALATDEKRRLVSRLDALAPDATALAGTALERPVTALCDAARGDGSLQDVCMVQGLVLENVGQATYAMLANSAALDDAGRALAADGRDAAAVVAARVPALVRASLGHGAALFPLFAERTAPVLARLDGLGEALDDAFGARFGIAFADVLGDFVSALVPITVDALGFERRKVVVHLTGALMSL